MRNGIAVFIAGIILLATAISSVSADDRLAYLVENLASKNPKPPLAKGADARWPVFTKPTDYNNDAQAQVYLAIQQLLHEGSPAFDILVEHFSDNRYSHTTDMPTYMANWTVAGTCRAILCEAVYCPLNDVKVFCHQQYRGRVGFRDKDVAAWWKKNRNRALWDLQVEIVDSELTLTESLTYETVEWLQEPDSHHHRVIRKLSSKEFDEVRDQNIKTLKAMRESLTTTHKPYHAEKLHDQNENMVGVPWKSWGSGGQK